MIYEFRNKETGEIEEHVMKLSEYDQFKEEHPELERVITAGTGGFIYEPGTRLKVDGGFQEVIAKADERLGKKVHRSGKW